MCRTCNYNAAPDERAHTVLTRNPAKIGGNQTVGVTSLREEVGKWTAE